MSYQGHRSWNSWNVSLHINNKEELYIHALSCIRGTHNRQEAAKRMLDDLTEYGVTETPDGAPYTVTSIREAMRGM